MNYILYHLLPFAVLFAVLAIGCSPDVQLRLVSVDELYQDSVLLEGVTMVEDTVEMERTSMVRRRYKLNGEGVLDEFIRLGRNGWGGGPVMEYLDARVFFLKECIIKRVEYFGETDSTGKMKFEGEISRIRFTWCGRADSTEEVWFRRGYLETDPEEKYIWNRFEKARQLKYKIRSKRGIALESTWWFNNGQLKYTSTQDTLVDSLKTVTYWHKNGNKQKRKTFIYPGGGIVDREIWNLNGVLITHENVSQGKRTIWSDQGELMHVFSDFSSSSQSITEATHYKKGEISSKTELKEGVIVSEELFGKQFKDSSMLYLDSAWTLQRGVNHGVDDPYAIVPQLEFFYDQAILHDNTNIHAYWKKMWLYGNDFKARRNIIEPLWKLDSTLFDCDQTLFYAYFLMHDQEYTKAENVLTLALERWDNGLTKLYEVYEQRARTYTHLGEFGRACSDINRVIEYKYLQENGDLESLIKAKYESIIKLCD